MALPRTSMGTGLRSLGSALVMWVTIALLVLRARFREGAERGAACDRWAFLASTSDLPVLGSVIFVVDADRVLDDDRVPAAEVVVEPLRIGWTQIGAPVADVALALIGD